MTRKENRIIVLLFLLISVASMLSACAEMQAEQQDTTTDSQYVPVEQNEELPVQELSYEDGFGEDGRIYAYVVGEKEKVENKHSFIKYMEYYKENEHLILFMNGKEYVYANVSGELWEEFKKAEKWGTFFNERININEEYWINDYNGKNGDLVVIVHIDG